MRRALPVLIVLGMMWVARRAAACDPMDRTWDLRSTAARAGLVVAAHRADAILALLAGDDRGEAFATFEVEAVLKGQPMGRRIVVATRWLQDEGVEVPAGRSAVLFLERSGDRYYPVSDDCAVRTLPVSNDRVLLAGVEVPFDVLTNQLGFAWAEEAPGSWPPGLPLAPIFAIACAGAGFALGHRVAHGGPPFPGSHGRRRLRDSTR